MEALTTILLVAAGLALLWVGYAAGKTTGALLARRRWERDLPTIRADAARRSRAVIGGQFSEQLAPFLPSFPWRPTEARFLGKPVDFLVFEGLDEKEVSEVVFVEVKSGAARLNGTEKSLKRAVEAGRVRWEEYRVPERLTGRKEP